MGSPRGNSRGGAVFGGHRVTPLPCFPRTFLTLQLRRPKMKIQKRRKLGRGVAVVGAGMSKFGMFRDRNSRDLFAEA